MEVRAHLRHLRIAPRKVRLVVDLIRGLHVDQAMDQLAVLPKASSEPIRKLLNSAIANAQHNFKLERQTLRIKMITANEGPRLKRYRPRAFGRAAEILKRSSHITVILEDDKKSAPPAKGKKMTKPTVVPTDAIAGGAPAKPAVKAPTKAKVDPTPATKKHDAADASTHRQGHE